MKVQCDVCENAAATVICCADEAALCAACDVEVHAANKLATKHQRISLLQRLPSKLPPCDICQEKTAFIFCVEDRALFCKDCDKAIHTANTRAANHQRFLATGIRVALSASCSEETVNESPVEPKPLKPLSSQQIGLKTTSQHVSSITSPSWAVDELLQFSDYDSSGKKEQLDFNDLDWLTDMNLFSEHVSEAAEVPQLPLPQMSSMPSYKPQKSYKKPRIETCDEDDYELFTVPDIG